MQALGQASDAEAVDVCHEQKLLHLTYHDPTENPLNITKRALIAQLSAAMAQYRIRSHNWLRYSYAG